MRSQEAPLRGNLRDSILCPRKQCAVKYTQPLHPQNFRKHPQKFEILLHHKMTNLIEHGIKWWKINFPLCFLWIFKILSQKIHSQLIFSLNAQNLAARFLNFFLDFLHILRKPARLTNYSLNWILKIKKITLFFIF